MRELSASGGRSGATMGRNNDIQNNEFPVVFEIQRLEWIDGDYDQGGAYWGRTYDDPVGRSGSDYIFRFEGESDTGIESMFVRAKSMKDAKDEVILIYPHASFAASADLEAIYSGYKDAALWSSTNDRYEDDPDSEAEMLGDTGYELAEATEQHFRAVCLTFIEDNADLVTVAAEKGMDGEQFGHNLWLSHNGHGTGFWDRGLGEVGDLLHKAAKKISDDYLYVGDDNKIHSSCKHLNGPETTVTPSL